MNNDTTHIVFDSPASKWEEALPVGNGRMGACVYGKVATELLQLNEDSIWFGGKRDRINPSAREYLPKIREAINEGRIHDAQEMCAFALSGIPEEQRHYEALGNLYILFEGDEQNVSEYSRTLDIQNSMVTVSFCKDNIRYKREIIASFPDKLIAIRLSADRKASLSFHTQLARGNVSWSLDPYQHQVYRHPDYNSYVDTVSNITSDTTIMTGQCGGAGAVSFACGITVKTVGGTLTPIGNSLVVKDADEATIYLYATSSFYNSSPKLQVLSHLKSASMSDFNDIYIRHNADYRILYDRVSLKLPESEWDIVRLFNFGRYLMISGSREGSQPLNLQGIWNKDFTPMWGSKYTININTEMNYWPAEVCNLSECHLPLFDLINRMLPNGREVAKRMYGCRGFAAHHNTDIWGDCCPQDVCLSSSYWVMGAAWLSLHIWDHYDYTGDMEFLRENYSTMLEAAQFVLDYFTLDNGVLVASPSISPENVYRLENGEIGVVCKGATMDTEIAMELFKDILKMSEVLCITDNETVAEVREALDKLPPIRINRNGCIQEWNEDYEELDPGHRHISHLFGLFPGTSITEENTELFEAAAKTIERRLSFGGGHTGWSRAWIINMYARLKKGDECLKHIRLLMEKSMLPNLFDNHPPFQIDGNFGLISGIAQMLVQGDGESPKLLPALPSTWKSGEIRGLRLRGNKTIDIIWEDNQVKEYLIR